MRGRGKTRNMQQRWKGLAESKKQKLLTAGILFLLAPFFEPGYVSLCAPLARVFYNAGEVLSTLIVLGLFLWNAAKKRRLSAAAITLIVLEGWMSVDILLQQGVSKAAFLDVISVLAVCMLIETMVSREHATELLRAFLLLYEILIGINLLTMIIWPDGLYFTPSEGWDNWFLGYRNMFLFYFAPALALELLNGHRSGKATRMNVMVIVCTVSMALSGSATGMIGILIFDALYITRLYRWRGCNILSVSIAALIAHVSIVLLNVQQFLAPLFALIGRSVTFTGRTEIWARMIGLIKESPIVGYGMQSDEVRGEVSGLWSGVKAHNLFLEQQYCFGVIGTVLLLCFLGVSAYLLYKNRKHPYACALCMGMIAYHILMLMESHINQVPMYSFFYIACFVEQFIRQMPAAKS